MLPLICAALQRPGLPGDPRAKRLLPVLSTVLSALAAAAFLVGRFPEESLAASLNNLPFHAPFLAASTLAFGYLLGSLVILAEAGPSLSTAHFPRGRPATAFTLAAGLTPLIAVAGFLPWAVRHAPEPEEKELRALVRACVQPVSGRAIYLLTPNDLAYSVLSAEASGVRDGTRLVVPLNTLTRPRVATLLHQQSPVLLPKPLGGNHPLALLEAAAPGVSVWTDLDEMLIPAQIYRVEPGRLLRRVLHTRSSPPPADPAPARRWWRRLDAELGPVPSESSARNPTARRGASRAANEYALARWRAGAPLLEVEELLMLAGRLFPDNLSARSNLEILLRDAGRDREADDIRRARDTRIREGGFTDDPGAWIIPFGWIRSPKLLVLRMEMASNLSQWILLREILSEARAARVPPSDYLIPEIRWLMASGRWEEARMVGETALRSPTPLEDRAGVARMTARADIVLGDWTRAERLMIEADSLDPTWTGIDLFWGEAWLDMGRLPRAKECLARYHQKFPDDLNGSTLLADLYLRQGNLRSALQILEAVPLGVRGDAHWQLARSTLDARLGRTSRPAPSAFTPPSE